MIFKTTLNHFAIFKKECERWIDRYGLKDWHIYFKHSEIEHEVCARAEADLENRLARITLNTEWEEVEPTRANLQSAAYHEVCHILLHRLTELALLRGNLAEIENEVHVIIRRLENAVGKI